MEESCITCTLSQSSMQSNVCWCSGSGPLWKYGHSKLPQQPQMKEANAGWPSWTGSVYVHSGSGPQYCKMLALQCSLVVDNGARFFNSSLYVVSSLTEIWPASSVSSVNLMMEVEDPSKQAVSFSLVKILPWSIGEHVKRCFLLYLGVNWRGLVLGLVKLLNGDYDQKKITF